MRTDDVLHLANLRAGYGPVPVIDGLSIEAIRPGRVTVLVGPNGAGKSTLLRAVAGLLPATGTIRLGDQDLTGAPARVRAARITFMPQLLPQGVALTVFEAVLTALRASPLEDLAFASARDLQRRAMATLERVGIAELAMSPLDHLSGGERQLASLAQAVVREPAVLLLDEPTSALDLRHQVSVMALVRELAADGRIVLAVLHDLGLTARWADDVVVLHRGRVHAAGAPVDAITAGMLADVYGVRGRVTTDGAMVASVVVDGVVPR